MACVGGSATTAGTDTVIAPCAAGTFSSSSGALSCTAWTACASGYTESMAPTSTSDRVCSDTDECLTSNGGCHAAATCTNTAGSRTCACFPGYTGDGITSCAAVSRSSCLTLRMGGITTSGMQTIDPDGSGPISSQSVYCDMTTDSGGYTFVKVSQATPYNAAQAEADCATRGMGLLVPRSQAHLQSAYAIANNAAIGPSATTNYVYLLGVYPKFNGATCANMQLNSSNPSCNWRATDNSTFYVSNMTGYGEPNGDNSTTSSMFYGYSASGIVTNYNDIGAPGYTSAQYICSTNDKLRNASCWDILINGNSTGSGVYTLTSGAGSYSAYCDMTSAGGGWTLALKANGNNTTFSYDQAIWTNTTLLNTASSALDGTEAKLQSFLSVPFSEVMFGLAPVATPGALTYRTVSTSAANLQAVFAGAYRATSLGRASWLGLGGHSLQPNCNQEGFNVMPAGGAIARVRIGIIGNNEGDCSSADSRIGIGGQGTNCGMIDGLSVGSSSYCGAVPTNASDIRSFGVVFVR